MHRLCCLGMLLLIALSAGCRSAVTNEKFKVALDSPLGYTRYPFKNPNVVATFYKDRKPVQPIITVVACDVSAVAFPPAETRTQSIRDALWAGIGNHPNLVRQGESERKVGSDNAAIIECTYQSDRDGPVHVREAGVIHNNTFLVLNLITTVDDFKGETQVFDILLNSVHWLP